MDSWFESFVFTFIPLFIVIDAFGSLPFFVSFSEGMTNHERNRTVHIAIFTAVLVGLIFLFFGQFILNVLDISIGSFAIAGGIILLVLSIKHMTTGRMVDTIKEEMVAVVPIGTPLLAGPAAITTLLLLVTQFPLYIVLISFVLNLLIVWLVFLQSNRIVHFMGKGGLKAISKVFSLLLAAIAVNMMIQGLDLLGVLEITS